MDKWLNDYVNGLWLWINAYNILMVLWRYDYAMDKND